MVFTAASFYRRAADSGITLNVARTVQGGGLRFSSAPRLQFCRTVSVERIARGHSASEALSSGSRSRSNPLPAASSRNSSAAVGFLRQCSGRRRDDPVDDKIDPRVSRSSLPRVDFGGVVSFSLFLFLLTLALISDTRLGWTDRHILVELVTAAALLAIFLVVEVRQERPMLDLGFFRRRTYIGSNITSLA